MLVTRRFLGRRPIGRRCRRSAAGRRPRVGAEDVRERLLLRGEQPPCLVVVVRRDHVRRHHGIGRLQLLGWPKLGAIELECGQQRVRCKVRGEGVRKAEHSREPGAEEARAEDPQRHVRARTPGSRAPPDPAADRRAGPGARGRRGESCRRSRESAAVRGGSADRFPARGRARDRSGRDGCAASVPNCSAITSGEWLGSMIPPAPTLIDVVPAATCAITTAVAALAIPAALWCSASQKRLNPHRSACWARSSEFWSASVGVLPSTMGARSRMETGSIPRP